MKVLHLTLKKQWFDDILAEVKLEEYREIKPYWIKRLHFDIWDVCPFDVIRFKNGYSSNCPEMDIELKGIKIGQGNTNLGAPVNQDVYILKLGKILSTKNIK